MPNVPPAPDWNCEGCDEAGRRPRVRQVEVRREVRQTAPLRAHDQRLCCSPERGRESGSRDRRAVP